MEDSASRKFRKEINTGAISLVLLSILRNRGQPMYGYEIARELRVRGGRQLPMAEGAIYPVLRSLERQRLLRSKLVPSESGPPRKYYALTAAGQRALVDWSSAWLACKSFVDSVLEQGNEPSDASPGRSIPGDSGTVRKARGGHRT